MNKTIVNNISHHFTSDKGILSVLENISFTVEAGEIIVILGPSGCGKSTLLRCISGLLTFISGDISINDYSSSQALNEKHIGFAFQDAALLGWRTVEENIKLPGEIGISSISAQNTKIKIDQLLSITKLEDFKNFYPSQLSGGMKQRVALARALFLEPKLLLLDEPFGPLDLLTRTNLTVELSKILREANIPTILVTHSIEEAVFLASRIIIFSSLPGRIIEEIEVEFNSSRDYSLFEEKKYLELVSHSRSTLLSYWENN